MSQIKKEDVLIPLLGKYFQNDVLFYNHFENQIKNGGDIYLSEPFGTSIIITNIEENNSVQRLMNVLKESKIFHQTICDKDELDAKMFEEKKVFSFERSIFKCDQIISLNINNKELKLTMYISIAETNMPYHMISFVFATPTDSRNCSDDNYEYTKLSNREIIDLLKSDTSENFKKLKECIEDIVANISRYLKIDKKTFIGMEFWRDDWKNDDDNILDVAKYICENPYYFYSIITMDVNIFRRNFENIIDNLGWSFSSSRVQRSVFSRNIYLVLTLKPRKEIINCIGHDSSEFKAWEILTLQNYLLDRLDTYYGMYVLDNIKDNHAIDDLEKYLSNIYDFNAFIKRIGKGEYWIKYFTYLQDAIGIKSYYELYTARYAEKMDKENKNENLNLTRLNTILSGLIFASIFLTIAIFLFDGKQNYFDFFLYNFIQNNDILKIIYISFTYTLAIAAFCVIFFTISIKFLSRILRNQHK